MIYTVSKPDRHVKGSIRLDGSKSISNRALIIRALCRDFFDIKNLSTSNDTRSMLHLLSSGEEVLDAGAAGTTFRFLAAYLATRPGSQTLTGSQRMKQRPIGVLVEALNQLGANIEYLEKEGYPPLRIHAPNDLGRTDRLSVPAGTSSQYLSALLLIAPTLPNGLILQTDGPVVSRPYLEMTLKMMEFFGVRCAWEEDTIIVPAQPYLPRHFTVEADWSAASYHYAIASFSDTCHLTLHGLFGDSWQGDAVLGGMMQAFGIETVFSNNEVVLRKLPNTKPFFEWDFLPCPDLAQTLAVVCGGLGVHGLFSGLDTLRIKETDRIAALQQELSKVQVYFSRLPARFSKKAGREYYLVEGTAAVAGKPVFKTYEDHRMAMALAPLAMFGEIGIEDPQVVGKSYPTFWEHLKALGFNIRGE